VQAPACRVCGKREWGHTCLASGVSDTRVEVPEGRSRRAERRVSEKGGRSDRLSPVEVSRSLVEVKGGFDRVKYQREYMRRRRSEGRERCGSCGRLLPKVEDYSDVPEV
jgi:hypothetical protein